MMRVFAITFARISLRIPFYDSARQPRSWEAVCSLSDGPQFPSILRTDRFCSDRLDQTERRWLFRYGKSDRNFLSAAFFSPVGVRVPATRPYAGMALNFKPTAEQGNALPHAGKAKRISPGQRLFYLKA